MKKILLLFSMGLLFIACDSSMLIKVELSSELSNENYSISDHNFILASSNGSDDLLFEFVTNKELPQNTVVTFYGETDKIISTKRTGTLGDLSTEVSENERSYAYSLAIPNFRSTSLIKEVVIGN